jgi:hypothetical protein
MSAHWGIPSSRRSCEADVYRGRDLRLDAELASLVRASLGDAASKVPTRQVLDFVVRLAGLFSKNRG